MRTALPPLEREALLKAVGGESHRDIDTVGLISKLFLAHAFHHDVLERSS